MEKMYLLTTITARKDGKDFEDFFHGKNISVVYSTFGEGTASQTILATLGVEESLKTIYYCLVPESRKNDLLRSLTVEMMIDLPNRGIAVSIPLSSLCDRRVLEVLNTQSIENTETEEKKMEQQCEVELIIAICEKGHTDEVMAAAREAGAHGGTVVHAKGTGSSYTDKFFAMSIADEKEMIYIVSNKEQKKDIMRSIMEKAGIDTKAHSIVFSLPASDCAGIRIFDNK